MARALFNFSNGKMSILCTNCTKIVRTSENFTEKDWQVLSNDSVESYYCRDCENLVVDLGVTEPEVKNKLKFLKEFTDNMKNKEFKENVINSMSEEILKKINL